MNSSQVDFKQRDLLIVAIPVLLIALALALFLYPSLDSLNGSQTIYRYAEQVRAGNGLVFNAGDHVLLVPAPLYMLLLGIVAILFPNVAIWTVAAGIFGLSVGTGALAIYWIIQRAGLAILPATVAVVLYVLAWPLWFGAGTAYPVAAMFCLLALAMALDERWRLSGVMLFLATLCAPESVLLAFPLLLVATSKNKGGRFIVAFALLLLIAIVVLRLYYGPSLWDDLLLFKANTTSGNEWLWMLPLPILGLAIWAFSRKTASPILNICAAWITLYLVIIGGLLRVETGASYAIIAGPGLLLVLIGGQFVFTTKSILRTVGFSVLVVMIVAGFFVAHPTIDSGSPRTFSPQTHTIGLNAYTFDINASSQQSLISFDGQLQPELKVMIERGDMQSALIRYAPDVLVIGNIGRLQARDLRSPALARLGYQPGDQAGVYVRDNTIGNFIDTPITAAFGPDITLTAAALDQKSLKPGQLLRVRLDWQLAQPASSDITIDLRLISGEGDEYILAHTTDTYDASVFRAGPYSTYHTLTVDDSAWNGPVTLQAAVEINGGVAARIPITTLNIATPRN